MIKEIDQKEGREGTILKIKGSGFSRHVRNNCVVVGGMGACARAQDGSSANELIVRVDPVARVSEGEIAAWVGIGSNFYTEEVHYGKVALHFTETAIFRNGTPVVYAGVSFRLTKPSDHTYGGTLEKSADSRASLGGHEGDYVLRAQVPNDLRIPEKSSVDVCLILKEHPTLAIDFTAAIHENGRHAGDILRAIAKTIVVNGGLVGQTIFADVVQDGDVLSLYVTRPYLETGLLTVHFGQQRAS